MNLSNRVAKIALCAWLFAAAGLSAADKPAKPVPSTRRLEIGVRIGVAPMRLFDTGYSASSTTTPVAFYSYTATTKSSKLDAAPTVTYRFSDRFLLGIEPRFHRAYYTQTTTFLSGRLDPIALYDDRKASTIVGTTKADYWEIPLLARYGGFLPTKWLAPTYIAAGLDVRHVGKVRTSNSTLYADSTKDSNTTPDPVHLTNQVGWVAGVGWRLIDVNTNIKVTPEIRFVKWQGNTFQGPAFHSTANQIELGVGFSF